MATLEELFSLLFQAHPWHGVPPGQNLAERVTVYVEIVPEDPIKYELDKKSGLLKVDRPQRYSSLCPNVYGFIPQTWCGPKLAARAKRPGIEGDGDPLDICVLTEAAVPNGDFILQSRPIGGFRMIDGNQADDKIVAVLEKDAVYGAYTDIAQAPKGVIERLRHYFLSYKQLPDEPKRTVEVAEIYGAAEARAVIDASIADYRDKYGAPETRLAELAKLLKA